MGKIWNESMIRKEIKALDAITGLDGASLKISFMRSAHTLGLFSAEGDMWFKFSMNYFHDPEWPEESAVGVIRHEYAHYMTWMQ